MSSADYKQDSRAGSDSASNPSYKSTIWLAVGAIVIPIYLLACFFSIIKAYRDRRAIKARIEARRLEQPLPKSSLSPRDIIAKEVRDHQWHRRKSSLTVSKIQFLLHSNDPLNPSDDCGDRTNSAVDLGDRPKACNGLGKRSNFGGAFGDRSYSCDNLDNRSEVLQ